MHIPKLALPPASLTITGQALARKGLRASKANFAVIPATASRIEPGQATRPGREVGRDAAGGAAAAGAGTAMEPFKCKSIAA